MRKCNFAIGEYYHIYNRGVEKRDIFLSHLDLFRFFQSIKEFNTINPIGSIFENSFRKYTVDPSAPSEKLVEIIAYCLNPNHYHLVVRQIAEKGVVKFMQRLAGGYTLYFNTEHKRSGVLFQGKFKAKHVTSDKYLLHLSVYVNGNNLLGSRTPKLSKSSLDEYLGVSEKPICNTGIVLEQFRDLEAYKRFYESSLQDIALRKQMEKDLEVELPS